jgi:hypothetical protein
MKCEVYVCNECGAQKQTANHWWMLSVSHPPVCMALMTWDEGDTKDEDVKHLCGRACVLAAVEKFMGHGTQQPRRADL